MDSLDNVTQPGEELCLEIAYQEKLTFLGCIIVYCR